MLLPSVLNIVNHSDLSLSAGHAEHPFESRKLNVDGVAAAGYLGLVNLNHSRELNPVLDVLRPVVSKAISKNLEIFHVMISLANLIEVSKLGVGSDPYSQGEV